MTLLIALESSMRYILANIETPPEKKEKKRRKRTNKAKTSLSNRKLKKKNYRELQQLYSRNRSKCYEKIFNDQKFDEGLTEETMFGYWKDLLETRSMNETERLPIPQYSDGPCEMMKPVKPEEVRSTRLPWKSSPGPDGITVKAWEKIPIRAKCKLFSIWLILGKVPEMLTKSRTVFIAKKAGACSPADARPISIASTIIRHLHKVLAKRLYPIVDKKLDQYQLGFRKMDGIAEGIGRLGNLLKNCQNMHQKFSLAILDLKKAFDSVSHVAISNALVKAKLSPEFIKYILKFYNEASTILSFAGANSMPIIPKRGVRQGDPLSPLIFLMVFDEVLKAVPSYEGVPINDSLFNHQAFADDLILVADSKEGLQNILNIISPQLEEAGLELNVDKCRTVTWVPDGKNKRLLYDSNPSLRYKNRPIPTLKADEKFKYLGVLFTVKGRDVISCEIKEKLEILSRATLKPQQRYFFLLYHLLPSYYHELAFAKLNAGALKKIDNLIRSFVRKVLHLPKDVPNCIIHAAVNDGGLGLPALRWFIPHLAAKRGIDCEELLKFEGKTLRTTSQINAMHKRQMKNKCDGKGLLEMSRVTSNHGWVTDGTALLTGRNYIHAVHVRLNTLYCRSRATRGRNKPHNCSRGCQEPETLNHILQKCYSTHGLRIQRHDKLVKYIARSLDQRGKTVHIEPKFDTREGVYKPDLVVYDANVTTVLDIQIINDQFPLEEAHENKVKKYKEALKSQLEGLRGETRFTSFTINWRGAISKSSANQLVGWHLLGKRDLKILTVRALEGSSVIWQCFQKMTARKSTRCTAK